MQVRFNDLDTLLLQARKFRGACAWAYDRAYGGTSLAQLTGNTTAKISRRPCNHYWLLIHLYLPLAAYEPSLSTF